MVYGSNLLPRCPIREQTREAIQEARLPRQPSTSCRPRSAAGRRRAARGDLPRALRRAAHPPYREPFVAVRQEVVPPMYESKPGWWIAKELATRLGLADFFPWADSMEYASDAPARGRDSTATTLQRDGVIVGPAAAAQLRGGRRAELRTPRPARSNSTRRPSRPPASIPLPVLHAAARKPPPGYYRLLFGRAPVHTFGRTTNNRLLSEVFAENEVWVNPQVAARWGLADGRARAPAEPGRRRLRLQRAGARDRAHPRRRRLHRPRLRAPGQGSCSFAYGRGIDSAELVTRAQGHGPDHGRHGHERELRHLRAGDEGRRSRRAEHARGRHAGARRRCRHEGRPLRDGRGHAHLRRAARPASSAARTENAVPDGYSRDWIVTETTGTFPALRHADPLRALQSLRGRPLRARLPDGPSHYGPGRHGAGHSCQVLGLQGVHRGLPLRRALRGPAHPHGRQVHASACTGSRTATDHHELPGDLPDRRASSSAT